MTIFQRHLGILYRNNQMVYSHTGSKSFFKDALFLWSNDSKLHKRDMNDAYGVLIVFNDFVRNFEYV